MTVSGNNSTTDPLSQTITVTHANTTRTDTTGDAKTQTAKGSITIPVVTGVTSDETGHVTAVQTTNYTLKDTNASMGTPAVTTTAFTKSGTNVGNVKTEIKLNDSLGATTTGTAYVNIVSSSLAITDNDTIGESSSSSTARSGLQIDMVWGSF
jgi:Tfp pilus assembly protein FimT